MKTKRIILLISILFPGLVNLPRVLFLFVNSKEHVLNGIIEVTPEDILFRALLLFGFSYVVLTFNLIWSAQISGRFKVVALVSINLLILIFWQFLFYLINQWVYSAYESVPSPGVQAIVYSFFLMMLVLISYVIKLFNKSKLDAIEKEILKRKSLESELNALRNQINPHFLFNSLNTLSLLVREDQKAAGKFINKLSFLFRYILQSQDQTLVSVKEELKVLDSYTHLIKQRYQGNFNVHVNIEDKFLQKQIPILALQMLMENAIKHNEISDKHPLYMEFYSEGKWIVAKNVLQKRTDNIESTNTGLRNLNSRTKLQLEKEIEIFRDDTHFIVKIPVL